MIGAFLAGLWAVIKIIVVILIPLLSAIWLKNKISEKMAKNKVHKVAFVDTREVVDEYLNDQINDLQGISMDDLEKMCEKTPYVTVNVDDEGETLTDFEGLKANEIESKVKTLLKNEEGMVIFEG